MGCKNAICFISSQSASEKLHYFHYKFRNQKMLFIYRFKTNNKHHSVLNLFLIYRFSSIILLCNSFFLLENLFFILFSIFSSIIHTCILWIFFELNKVYWKILLHMEHVWEKCAKQTQNRRLTIYKLSHINNDDFSDKCRSWTSFLDVKETKNCGTLFFLRWHNNKSTNRST